MTILFDKCRGWPAFAFVSCLLLSFLLNRSGMPFSPDSWSLWQGAISLAEGRGYSYLSGTPIIAWTPLYSLYLALFTLMFGPFAASAFVANAILIALQASLWTCLAVILVSDGVRRRARFSYALTAFFTSLFLALNERGLSCISLLYLFLPIYLICISLLKDELRLSRAFVILTLICSLLLLSHNMAIAMIAAGQTCYIVYSKAPLRSRAGVAIISLGFSVLIWIIVRHHFGQLGSHNLFTGNNEPLGNLLRAPIEAMQLLTPHNFFATSAFGILLIAGFVHIVRFSSGLPDFSFPALFTAITICILSVIFALIYINDVVFGARFILFAPLLFVPLIFFHAEAIGLRFFSIVVVILFPVLVGRVISMAFFVPHADTPMNTELSRALKCNEKKVVNGIIEVGPYGWEEPLGGYTRNGEPIWGSSQTPAKRCNS